MPIVTIRSGRSFGLDPGQSLLEAAEASGATLPYSCRTGRCSTCKCKVVGATDVLFSEIGLSTEEREAGWVLACARSAQADVTVDIEDLSALGLERAQIVPAKILSLLPLSQDVIQLKLRLPPRRKMRFLAGQYADVIGPGGVRRSYSYATNLGDEAVEFHIRHVPGGEMSAYWFDKAKVNDLVRLHGPKGTFVLRHTSTTDLVFLATGTGIAPVKSMLEEIATLSEGRRPRSISVFWGGRTEGDLYWDPLRLMDQIDYFPCLSRAGAGWRGERGYVQDIFLATNPDLSSTQVYACGSEAMIHDAKSILISKGLSEENFFSDAFVESN